jgi:HEPN domain-containing protein
MTLQGLLNQWFGIAANDLTVATRCFADFYPKQLDIACYHCQQAAEKALKGFLAYCNIEPPKTHNLDALCAMCVEKDVTFSAISVACAKVNPYGNVTRYPKEMMIDEAKTQAAINHAQTILAFCREKVPVVI